MAAGHGGLWDLLTVVVRTTNDLQMTTRILSCQLFLLFHSLVSFGQNSTVVAKTITDSAKTDDRSFIERYYEIRDSYPELTAIHGNFAAASCTKEKFMKKY